LKDEYNKPMGLTNSKRNEYWAKQFLNKLEQLINSGQNEMIELTLGDPIRGKAKKYSMLRENLQSIVNYSKYLLANSLVKPISAAGIANRLIYLADFCGKKRFMDVNKEDIERFFEKYSNHSENYKVGTRRIVKPFFRWLYGFKKKHEYPEVVDWIYCGRKNNYKNLPQILTMEEITKMLDSCRNLRDRALISVLYESGCRASEILDLKIGDLNFDQYGASLVVSGKTGSRRIRLISSVADLKAWLNTHPDKNNPNAPLFCALTKNKYGSPLADSSLGFIISEIAKRAGIKKRVYPHIFRHTRATHLAKKLSEQELKVYFGWTRDSKMASVYVHLSGKDVEDKILEMNGIKSSESREAEKIPTIKCYRCGEMNSISNKFCWKCGAPLTEEKIKETEMTVKFLSEIVPIIFEKMKEREITNKDLDDLSEIIRGLYNKKQDNLSS